MAFKAFKASVFTSLSPGRCPCLCANFFFNSYSRLAIAITITRNEKVAVFVASGVEQADRLNSFMVCWWFQQINISSILGCAALLPADKIFIKFSWNYGLLNDFLINSWRNLSSNYRPWGQSHKAPRVCNVRNFVVHVSSWLLQEYRWYSKLEYRMLIDLT